jgi:hypothetical protein
MRGVCHGGGASIAPAGNETGTPERSKHPNVRLDLEMACNAIRIQPLAAILQPGSQICYGVYSFKARQNALPLIDFFSNT